MSLDNWTANFSFSIVRHNVICKTVMRGSRNFRQGGRGQVSSDNVFFCYSSQLILQKSNGQFKKKTIIFQGSRGGQTLLRGPNFFRGGGGGGGGPIAYYL